MCPLLLLNVYAHPWVRLVGFNLWEDKHGSPRAFPRCMLPFGDDICSEIEIDFWHRVRVLSIPFQIDQRFKLQDTQLKKNMF